MGMYTEIYVNVDFKKSTPDDVINTVKAICNKELGSKYLLGRARRWALLFNNGSYYTPHTEANSLTFDDIGNQYSLIGKGDIKNYESEIEEFFEFIRPWVENEFMGYYRYEEDREPVLYYKTES